MTDLGLLRQFLGLEIEKSERGIMPSQPKYDSDLLSKFEMAEYKSFKYPFLSGIKLHEFGNSPLVDFTLYRQLVSSLLYITHTMHDLYYAVSAVEIHMHQPHEKKKESSSMSREQIILGCTMQLVLHFN